MVITIFTEGMTSLSEQIQHTNTKTMVNNCLLKHWKIHKKMFSVCSALENGYLSPYWRKTNSCQREEWDLHISLKQNCV